MLLSLHHWLLGDLFSFHKARDHVFDIIWLPFHQQTRHVVPRFNWSGSSNTSNMRADLRSELTALPGVSEGTLMFSLNLKWILNSCSHWGELISAHTHTHTLKLLKRRGTASFHLWPWLFWSCTLEWSLAISKEKRKLVREVEEGTETERESSNYMNLTVN